jgi:hypothetical protein
MIYQGESRNGHRHASCGVQVDPSNRIGGSRLTNKVGSECASRKSVDEGKDDLNFRRKKG